VEDTGNIEERLGVGNMFGNSKQKQAASGSITVIAAGSVVEGTLRVKGMLQLDGTIQGILLAEGHVSVGPDGKILGDVTGDNLSIAGRIEGTVNARGHLHVLSSGVVQGGARYASLEVERGGVMDGRASRLDEKAQVPENDVEMIADVAAAE
jgi:cytoskeletal protein CcmA (bactofilin family)